MKSCTVVGHIGLGDLVLLCPIGIYLSQIYDKVYFPARCSDKSSLITFFVNHPRIELYWPHALPGLDVFPFPASDRVIRTGIYHYEPRLPIDDSLSFIENYYQHADVPMSVRWDYCPLKEASRQVEQYHGPSEPFEFIHDAPERGYTIRGNFKNPFFVRDQPRNLSILRYVDMLRNAAEIHCMDSCFLHLAESVQTNGSLFYHKYCKPLAVRFNDVDVPSRKLWNVLT